MSKYIRQLHVNSRTYNNCVQFFITNN